MRGDGGVMVGRVCVCMYVHVQVSEWECEWVMWVWCVWVMWVWSVWVRDVRVSEWVSGWVGGVSEWVEWSEWVREGVSEWERESDVSEWCEWCECGLCESGMWEWVSECVSEWMSEWVSNEWGSEWVREWVSACVCEGVYVSAWLWFSKWHRPASWPQETQHAKTSHDKLTSNQWRTSDVHIVPCLPHKSGGAPSCPTPATPKGRQGVDPTPWQRTLSYACHAKEAEPHGTPGRTSDPLAAHIVPRLPRKRGGAPRHARAYIEPVGSAHCPTPATQKGRSPKGRQGVHPTPWQCTLSHACHAKEAEPQGTPGRTSDPLAVHIVPRLPRKSGGAPTDARAYIRPLGSAHCPTPATQKKRSPKGRQGVHPTPWQCTLSHACHAKAAEPQGMPGRASDPLAMHIVPRLPRKRGGAPRTPGRTPDALAVHTGRTSDPLAVHIVPRLPRKRGGAPRDAKAYIRPLGSAHCPTPATQKRRSPTDARAYIRPLGSAHCPTPATQKQRSPKGRQDVHPTPWQCTLSHACHIKEADLQGTPGRTSDPLARKRRGAPRDARAYIRPLGSAHCPTPATQKRRSPKGRQGVHPTPWQCTLSHACHAKAAEPQGTPGRTSNPLAVHIVPRLPLSEWMSEWERESDVSEWCECGLCEWGMCEWVSEWEREWCEWVMWVWSVWVRDVWVSEWGREGVSEWVEEGGADTELNTKTPHVNVGKNAPNH